MKVDIGIIGAMEDEVKSIIDKLSSVEVEYIGDKAFYWCRKLKSVCVGSGLIYLGNNVFDKKLSERTTAILNKQIIEINHKAMSKEIFAVGAVVAEHRVVALGQPGNIGMDMGRFRSRHHIVHGNIHGNIAQEFVIMVIGEGDCDNPTEIRIGYQGFHFPALQENVLVLIEHAGIVFLVVAIGTGILCFIFFHF